MKVVDRKKIVLTSTSQEIALPIIQERAVAMNKERLCAEDCVVEADKPVTVKCYVHDAANVFNYTPHRREMMSSIYIDENEIAILSNDEDFKMMKIGSVVVEGAVGTVVKLQLTYDV